MFKLLKSGSGSGILGFIFTSLSLFVLVPLVIILSIILKEPYNRYDFKEIRKNGTEKRAVITFIKTLYNVNINGVNPMVISYEYTDGGQKFTDSFETLDVERTTGFTIGKEINILEFESQTMIKGLEPFSFPVELFFILPGMFLITGVPLLLIALIPALRIFKLYKTGIVKEAIVVSLNSKTTMTSLRRFSQSFLVNYYYFDDFGNKIYGESASNDLLLTKELKTGDTIKIFVSERNETKSCLIPKLEATKYNWAI